MAAFAEPARALEGLDLEADDAALDGNPREKFVSVEAMLEAIGR